MPRARTGQIVPKPNGLHARVTVDALQPDGTKKPERRLVDLETHDPVVAEQKMAKLLAMIAAGEIVADAKPKLTAYTCEELHQHFHDERVARGVGMASSEMGYWKHHIREHIGAMPVAAVGKVPLRRVLDRAAEKGHSKGGVAHLHRYLGRFFRWLEMNEHITTNPMRIVAMPTMKADKRPYTLPTDGEIAAVYACATVDLETKCVIVVARTLGGSRAAEIIRWSWDMLDRVHFAECVLPRAKTGDGDVQSLVIPEVLRPALRAWWEMQGEPKAGPVFPVTKGPRRGKERGRGLFAARVRRAFVLAGQTRHELHHDTAHSRRLNFHSMRRAFVSALATSGTNEQTSMALAHHADSRVHRGYMHAQIREVPAAAVPTLPALPSVPNRTRRKDPPVPFASRVAEASANSSTILERATGFEPATSSLGTRTRARIPRETRSLVRRQLVRTHQIWSVLVASGGRGWGERIQ